MFREGNTQFSQKINVWAGIFWDDIIGPIFMEENLTGELYLNISENVIDPLITMSLENQVNEGNLVLDEQNLHFQQDGAPPHYAVPVRQWLDRRFQEKRDWLDRCCRMAGEISRPHAV